MILRDLQNRVDKVVRLEIQLDESKEMYRKLQTNFASGDKPLHKKIAQLDRNCNQLTLMYHAVVSEKSVIKVDFQILQKKQERKENKMRDLEKAYSKLRDQVSFSNSNFISERPVEEHFDSCESSSFFRKIDGKIPIQRVAQ